MDTFFKQLLAENDPARLAAWPSRPRSRPTSVPRRMAAGGSAMSHRLRPPCLEADAAAEAEAEATEGLDLIGR